MPLSAASVYVPVGGDLQAAFNQAQAGDTITIAAGATFYGNFALPPNPVRQWITIQSSAMANLPGAGARVTPQFANLMPKIVTPNAGSALTIPSGSSYYKIQGVEFTVGPQVYVNDLVAAGIVNESSASQLPHHLVFDRDYFHGDPNWGGKRGLALNSAMTVVENSYFETFISNWQDTQAICGWNGSGPFIITNNHLEAGGEIVAFGGATTSIPNLIPSNIVVQNNEFYKPMKWWYSSPNYIGWNIRAKNHLEIKNGKNVLIENNHFDFNFVGADQLGFMLVFGVRDEVGHVPWATVSDVYVRHNLFEHSAAGVLFMGHDADGGGTAGSFFLQNNTWLDIGGYGGDGRMYEILNDVKGVSIDHETAFSTGWLEVFSTAPSSNVRVTNGIYGAGSGIGGEGYGAGESVLAHYTPDGIFANNAVIGGWWWGFTGTHFQNISFPGYVSDVGFVNFTNDDVRLASTSPYAGKATDGSDLGSSFVSGLLNAPGSAQSLAPNGWVNIVTKVNGRCMDLATYDGSHWGQDQGTPVDLWDCTGYDMQKFQLTPATVGYSILIKISKQSFDVSGGPTATDPGTRLVQWPYWGGANENFQIVPASDGYVTLQPVHSGLCLTLSTDTAPNGTAVLQQTCTGADTQLWKIVPSL